MSSERASQKLSNGNEKLYQIYRGTYYTDGMIMADGTHDNRATPQKVMEILETYRTRKIETPIRVFYGSEDGCSWMDENFIAGHVGRSNGRIKIPILMAPDAISGGALLDACIIRIDTRRVTLWSHANFHTPAMSLKVGDLLELPYEVWWNDRVQARFFLRKQAERYMGILSGAIFPDPKIEPGAFGIDDPDAE